MEARISIVANMCAKHECSSTDIYIAAALSENGPGFSKDKSVESLGLVRNIEGDESEPSTLVMVTA